MKKIVLLLLPLAVMMASCRSSKNVAKNDKKADVTTITTNTSGENKTLESVQMANFTAKVKATVGQNGKDITTSGTLRMRRDDVIQIALVDPFLGISEVGRIELSPDGILIIDRLNKRYVKTTYEEFAPLRDKGINFNMIQDYFWEQAEGASEVSYTMPGRTGIKLDLKLSDKGSSENWEAHTSVSDKYTKTDANKLFSSLLGQ